MQRYCQVILIILLLSLFQVMGAKPLATGQNYDNIPITPKTWEKIYCTYLESIHGKKYPAYVQLLRPIQWAHRRGIYHVSNHFYLSAKEFGINNALATVTAVKPTSINTTNTYWQYTNKRPTISVFIRPTDNVWTYHFKTDSGKIIIVHATPTHRFYVANLQRYLPVSTLTALDKLVLSNGHSARLVCPNTKRTNCGKPYHKGKITAIYNFEVYQRHNYFVSKQSILVHNDCGRTEKYFEDARKWLFDESGNDPYYRLHFLDDDETFISLSDFVESSEYSKYSLRAGRSVDIVSKKILVGNYETTVSSNRFKISYIRRSSDFAILCE